MSDVELSHPACFASLETYRLWEHQARLTDANERHGFCADCLPRYKRQMLRAGRCAHPDVKFHVDEDGFTEGRRPLIRKEKAE